MVTSRQSHHLVGTCFAFLYASEPFVEELEYLVREKQNAQSRSIWLFALVRIERPYFPYTACLWCLKRSFALPSIPYCPSQVRQAIHILISIASEDLYTTVSLGRYQQWCTSDPQRWSVLNYHTDIMYGPGTSTAA